MNGRWVSSPLKREEDVGTEMATEKKMMNSKAREKAHGSRETLFKAPLNWNWNPCFLNGL